MKDGFAYKWTPLETTECARCERPLLRESLPALQCVATFEPVDGAMQQFEKNMNIGQAHEFPPMLVNSFFPMDVEFEFKESKLLCFRCMMEFETWWEMSDDQKRQYDEVDQVYQQRR